MTVIATSDTSFEADVLKSPVPVVVDFWAEWCGPCKTIAPFLEELAADKSELLVVAKVNIDDNPLTPTKFGVRGIPTLMLFRNGEIAATKVGAMPKTKLYEWVEESLQVHAPS
jgi:thioredoxin 1